MIDKDNTTIDFTETLEAMARDLGRSGLPEASGMLHSLSKGNCKTLSEGAFGKPPESDQVIQFTVTESLKLAVNLVLATAISAGETTIVIDNIKKVRSKQIDKIPDCTRSCKANDQVHKVGEAIEYHVGSMAKMHMTMHMAQMSTDPEFKQKLKDLGVLSGEMTEDERKDRIKETLEWMSEAEGRPHPGCHSEKASDGASGGNDVPDERKA